MEGFHKITADSSLDEAVTRCFPQPIQGGK